MNLGTVGSFPGFVDESLMIVRSFDRKNSVRARMSLGCGTVTKSTTRSTPRSRYRPRRKPPASRESGED